MKHNKILSELPFNFQIRRSDRAKKTRLVVSDKKIEVVAPHEVNQQTIIDFVHKQQDWVVKTLNKLQNQIQSVQNQQLGPAKFIDGAMIPYQGEKLRLHVKPNPGKRLKIERHASVGLIAHLPAHLQKDSHEHIRSAIIKWLIEECRQSSQHYVDKHAERHQLFPRTIRIKNMKTRWGSCGVKNDLNINWNLILAPPIVMEYVIIHEICHIRHRNHSRDFWGLVEQHMPDYKVHRNWLKEHGHLLMRGLG